MTQPMTLDDWAARQNVHRPGLRPDGRTLTIQERFEEFLGTPDGRLVHDELVRRAAILRDRGWKHYSAKAIIETIRYDANMHVGPDGGFKVNDVYTSRLVRRVIDENPALASFFELRELRAS